MSEIETYLSEVEARCEAASEGPWFAIEIRPDGLTQVDDGKQHGMTPFAAETFDALFIAHARTELPRLLALVRQYREALELVVSWSTFKTEEEWEGFQDAIREARAALEAMPHD